VPTGERVAKLVDFGLASFLADPAGTPPLADGMEDRQGEETATTGGPLLGTPTYLAPELWQGQPPSAASDLWAFGVLAFLTLTGKLPFPGLDPAAIRAQIARGAPAPSSLRPELDPALDAALLAPLQPDPAARPARAREVVAGIERALLAVERRRWRRREVPRRLGLAALLGALGSFVLLPLTGPLAPLENRLIDARFHLAAPRPPRFAPLLVLIDDATLASDRTSLADQADKVGALLDRVFAAGARGVGIDLLLPGWCTSRPFVDLVLRHSGALVLALSSPDNGKVVGAEVVCGPLPMVLGPESARGLLAFVDVEEDEDGVIRHAQPVLRDTAGQLQETFAARLARFLLPAVRWREEEVWIDGTIDWRSFEPLSFRDLADALERDPGRFRNRLVLLGADFAASGDDHHRIPHPRALPETLSGSVLQALIAETLFDGAPVRSPGRAQLGSILALAAAATAGLTLLGRRSAAAAAGPATAAAWIVAAFALFATHRLLVPVAGPAVALLVAAALAALLRRGLPRFPLLL
jgi:CHASE2 domain-containing sensor protein